MNIVNDQTKARYIPGENTRYVCTEDLSREEIRQALDNGATLAYRWNTECRMDFIQAIPHGYGWFYNGDRAAMGASFDWFIDDNRVYLPAWILCIPQTSRPDPDHTQPVLPLTE